MLRKIANYAGLLIAICFFVLMVYVQIEKDQYREPFGSEELLMYLDHEKKLSEMVMDLRIDHQRIVTRYRSMYFKQVDNSMECIQDLHDLYRKSQ